jgi:glycolate oxidase FAD binding subunit
MALSGDMARRLGELVGAENVSDGTVFPGSAEEVAGVLALADAVRLPVIPAGNSSQPALGGPAPAGALRVCLRRLNRVKQYEPADLTASLQAGVTLADFGAVLAPHRQWLPLAVPRPELATLGGILATNSSGPFRLFYGTARDMVIGLRFATAEGKVIKSGGMVVKNVAGYDMVKLLIGSFGTLGIITEVNVRVYPHPVTETTALGFRTAAAAFQARSGLLNSPVAPLALDLLNASAAAATAPQELPRNRYVLLVAYGGVTNVIERARREVEAAGRAAGLETSATLAGEQEQRVWRAVCDLPATLAGPNTVRLKISSTLDQMRSIVERLETDQPARETALAGRAGSGILYVYARGGDLPAFCRSIREFAGPLPAHVVVEFAPPGTASQLDIWGPKRDDYGLMLKLKQVLDPNGILNPGRFVV